MRRRPSGTFACSGIGNGPDGSWLIGRLLLVLFAATFLGGGVRAQTTFTVADPVRASATSPYLWVPLTAPGSNGTFMVDASLDQKGASAYQYDLVGTTTQAGFMIRYGAISGVDSVGFRMMVNVGTGGTYAWAGVAGVGLDTNNDGYLDIMLYASSRASPNNGLFYSLPPAGSFNSGNDSSFGTAVQISALNSSNFNFSQVTSTLYPGWNLTGTLTDGMVSFAVPFATINTALTGAGLSALTTSTLVRMVGFTSTDGKINQDVFGPSAVDATLFSATNGGFTEYTDLTGRPIPEPATVASSGAMCFLWAAVWWRRRRSGLRS